jgi:TrmH family RNA methyltransferase
MEEITSLNSPHIARVKALLGSRGKKNREIEQEFIAEGIQAVREALNSKLVKGLTVNKVYVTDAGLNKLKSVVDESVLRKNELVLVSDPVMKAMADSETPQGILALCSINHRTLQELWNLKPKKIAFFWQIQDPGNAGTVIRSADAAGFDAVVLSKESVDAYNPKTVRATVGSLWHIPVFCEVAIEEFIAGCDENKISLFALTGDGKETFDSKFVAQAAKNPSAWIFGNEARGLPTLPDHISKVSIPMMGFAESLNVASAAAIVLHSVGLSL